MYRVVRAFVGPILVRKKSIVKMGQQKCWTMRPWSNRVILQRYFWVLFFENFETFPPISKAIRQIKEEMGSVKIWPCVSSFLINYGNHSGWLWNLTLDCAYQTINRVGLWGTVIVLFSPIYSLFQTSSKLHSRQDDYQDWKTSSHSKVSAYQGLTSFNHIFSLKRKTRNKRG